MQRYGLIYNYNTIYIILYHTILYYINIAIFYYIEYVFNVS